jgi:hypothetical protein
MLIYYYLRMILLPVAMMALALAGRLLMDAFDRVELPPPPPVDLLDRATQLDMAAGGKLWPITQ